MSDSKKKEIIDFLQSYPAGQVYTLAPKEYIVSGFDYYKRGNLRKLEWNKDFSVLSAKVRGTRLYSVDFSLDSSALKHSCDCHAWSLYSNCKHVICSLITLKNLLQPDIFRVHNQDKECRTFLLKCLIMHNGFLFVDKKKQLLLYKIPYELFGWTIFKDTPAYSQMIVNSKDLYENLPLLYERLKEEGIELFFDNKLVKTSQWDFAFDACRPSGIDWFEIKPEIRCNGELVVNLFNSFTMH